ncbi:MAG TPA: hypothetical protein VN461_19455 [Vicinamibacteria bacterium]|nr:hypothetical protein [Vicinamibacteria bacterium]
MKERSRGKRAGTVGALGLLLLAAPAGAWGPIGERLVIARAVDTLPKPLNKFYKDHRLEMPSLAPDSRPGPRTPDRRFEVDRLLPFPFLELPRTEKGLQEKFGEDVSAKVGRLPWLIQESYARLLEAFRSRDKGQILTESDTLAGLVADLNNPLSLTENSDGQKTGQNGLGARFSERSLEAWQTRLGLNPETAVFLDDPKQYVFSIINGTYIWLDNLLYQEELARRGKAGYTEIYYEDLERRVGPITKERLSRAASDAGSYWYTAWTQAGRPELK